MDQLIEEIVNLDVKITEIDIAKSRRDLNPGCDVIDEEPMYSNLLKARRMLLMKLEEYKDSDGSNPQGATIRPATRRA